MDVKRHGLNPHTHPPISLYRINKCLSNYNNISSIVASIFSPFTMLSSATCFSSSQTSHPFKFASVPCAIYILIQCSLTYSFSYGQYITISLWLYTTYFFFAATIVPSFSLSLKLLLDVTPRHWNPHFHANMVTVTDPIS